MPPRPAATLPRPTPAGPPPGPTGLVVFVSDFGTRDAYAAEMAGALLKADPRAVPAAGHHGVPPQDVAAGAEALGRLVTAWPAGTTFVTVVDPGVGTDRAVLAATAGGQYHVAPDNGLLAALLDADPAAEAVRLPAPPPGASATFHGRDQMAPAAGRLTRGVPLASLGEAVADWARLPAPYYEIRPDGTAAGEVTRPDHFGNLLTTLPAGCVEAPATLHIAGRTINVGRTYGDVGDGESVALAGSSGYYEVAVRNGSAAAVLGVGRGERVEVRGASVGA